MLFLNCTDMSGNELRGIRNYVSEVSDFATKLLHTDCIKIEGVGMYLKMYVNNLKIELVGE